MKRIRAIICACALCLALFGCQTAYDHAGTALPTASEAPETPTPTAPPTPLEATPLEATPLESTPLEATPTPLEATPTTGATPVPKDSAQTRAAREYFSNSPFAYSGEAPDFSLRDVQGNAHALSDYRGKALFLNIWAYWCGYCIQEMPTFQSAHEKGYDDFAILTLAICNDEAEVQQTLDQIQALGLTFPVLLVVGAEEQAQIESYLTGYFPTSYFIDAAGNFQARIPGAMEGEQFLQAVEQARILAGE